jgi:glycine/D-amino acid oxidase-like deaminating enzyme
LPQAVDLAIIGGGIIGIFTALYARRMGMSVAVLEKGRIAGEQSSRNWGWCRQQARDADELPIVMEANRLWGDIDTETGGGTGFKRVGCFYLARDEAKLDLFEKWAEVSKQHQLETKRLSAADLDTHFEGGAKTWAGGVYTPSDGKAEPWKAVPAVAKLAHNEGVHIVENCAVRALDMSGGRVTGVIPEHGIIRAEQTVLAGGAWSSMLLRHHRAYIPQLAIRGTVARTAPMPDVGQATSIDEGLSFRRREDGGYTISSRNEADFFIGPDAIRATRYYLPVLTQVLGRNGYRPASPKGWPDAWGTPRRWSDDAPSPFEAMRVLDPAPNAKHVKKAAAEFGKRFPRLGTPQITSAWGGMIDTMPDLVPVVDHANDLPGLIVATGMSGHGFGMGPGMGKVVAELAAARTPGHDISRFRYARFTDGTKIRPGPAV